MSFFQPSYLLFVGVGVIIALAFPVARHIRDERLRRQYYLLQGITLVGALFGAKVSVLFGDHNWPFAAIKDWPAVLWSGRSLTGALIFGFLFAELAKPMLGYRMPPNDRFAAVLPFTIAIGRFGCLTAGCCGGLPCDRWFCIAGPDGVSRYPTQVFEMFFQVGIGVLFIFLIRRRLWFGRLFSFYLIAYGVFRFLTEFLRATPKFFGILSGYQLLSMLMIALGAAFFLKRTLAPPRNWNEFRLQTEPTPTLEASRV
jgi:phosphatidylglycerol:prolipoprotein diacylglycerol transferase